MNSHTPRMPTAEEILNVRGYDLCMLVEDSINQGWGNNVIKARIESFLREHKLGAQLTNPSDSWDKFIDDLREKMK